MNKNSARARTHTHTHTLWFERERETIQLVNWLLAPSNRDCETITRDEDSVMFRWRAFNIKYTAFWVFGVISFAYFIFFFVFLLFFFLQFWLLLYWELPYYSTVERRKKKPAGEMKFTQHWYSRKHKVKFLFMKQIKRMFRPKHIKTSGEKKRFTVIAIAKG